MSERVVLSTFCCCCHPGPFACVSCTSDHLPPSCPRLIALQGTRRSPVRRRAPGMLISTGARGTPRDKLPWSYGAGAPTPHTSQPYLQASHRQTGLPAYLGWGRRRPGCRLASLCGSGVHERLVHSLPVGRVTDWSGERSVVTSDVCACSYLVRLMNVRFVILLSPPIFLLFPCCAPFSFNSRPVGSMSLPHRGGRERRPGHESLAHPSAGESLSASSYT